MIRFLRADSSRSLEMLASMRLITACELKLVRGILGEPALGACLEMAETIHLHVKLDDTRRLDGLSIEAAGGTLDHAKPGFVKYRLPGALNAIFSDIPVSTEDLGESAVARRPRPFLDHVGIDVRRIDREAHDAFRGLPAAAARRGWAHVAQGGASRPVRCCHVEVAEKHWLFPDGAGARPVEVALGPLVMSDGASGCDLRPAHPASPQSVAAACCAAREGLLELRR